MQNCRFSSVCAEFMPLSMETAFHSFQIFRILPPVCCFLYNKWVGRMLWSVFWMYVWWCCQVVRLSCWPRDCMFKPQRGWFMSYRHFVLERLLVSVVLIIKMYILRIQCQGVGWLPGCCYMVDKGFFNGLVIAIRNKKSWVTFLW